MMRMNRRKMLNLTASALVWPVFPKNSWALVKPERHEDIGLIQSVELKVCGHWATFSNGRVVEGIGTSPGCKRSFLVSRFYLPWGFNPNWNWNGKVFWHLPERDGNFFDAYYNMRELGHPSERWWIERKEQEQRYVTSTPMICPHCGHHRRDIHFVRGTTWSIQPIFAEVSLQTFYERHKFVTIPASIEG